MQNKKIAMFFSGRIKVDNFDTKLLAFIKEYNIDLFISTNDDSHKPDESILDNVKIHETKSHDFHKFSTEQIDEITSHKRYEVNLTNMYSMFFHHQNNINNILQYQTDHNILYDIIIYGRYDLIINEDHIRLEDPEDYLMIPDGSDYFGYNDQFAYGNLEIMKIYCSLTNHFYEYATMPYYFNPEIILKRHLDNYCINTKRFTLNYGLSASRHSPPK